jgi:hypothetical protein
MAQAKVLLCRSTQLTRCALRPGVLSKPWAFVGQRTLATAADTKAPTSLKVDQNRLWNDIHLSSKIGANNRYGK